MKNQSIFNNFYTQYREETWQWKNMRSIERWHFQWPCLPGPQDVIALPWELHKSDFSTAV